MKTVILCATYLGHCGCGYHRKVARSVVIKESQTLDDLQDAIICKSFGWEDPHLYSFHMDNKPYSENRLQEYSCDDSDEFGQGKPNTTRTRLKELNLKKGQRFLFVFDFGDDHQFSIRVEGFGETETGKDYPLILKETGRAPKQYS